MGEVEEGVRRDLDALPSDLARSGLAMTALALARDVDAPDTAAYARAQSARELREALLTLHRLAPPERTDDDLDRLSSSDEPVLRLVDAS